MGRKEQNEKKRKAAASSCQSRDNFVRKMPRTEESDFAMSEELLAAEDASQQIPDLTLK